MSARETNTPPISEISSEPLYEDKFVKVKLAKVKASWGIGEYCSIETNPSAAAVILIGDSVCLIEQYRYPALTWGYEIPQGLADPNDDDIVNTLKREVKEETGLTVVSVEKIASLYPEPDRNKSSIAVYQVRAEGSLKLGSEGKSLKLVPLKDIPSLIKEGKISESASLFGVTWVLAKL